MQREREGCALGDWGVISSAFGVGGVVAMLTTEDHFAGTRNAYELISSPLCPFCLNTRQPCLLHAADVPVFMSPSIVLRPM